MGWAYVDWAYQMEFCKNIKQHGEDGSEPGHITIQFSHEKKVMEYDVVMKPGDLRQFCAAHIEVQVASQE